jgi:hypothetical protein
VSYTKNYAPGGWQDEPTETTPINAAALQHIEDGIAAAADTADTAAAAVTAEVTRAEAAEAGKVTKAGDAMTGPLSPKVVTLTDAATILVDATQGNDLRVTLGGNRTLGAPSGGVDGQAITVAVKQDATGGRTLAFAAAYKFGTAGAPTVTATANAADVLAFKLYGTDWRYLGGSQGF